MIKHRLQLNWTSPPPYPLPYIDGKVWLVCTFCFRGRLITDAELDRIEDDMVRRNTLNWPTPCWAYSSCRGWMKPVPRVHYVRAPSRPPRKKRAKEPSPPTP